MDSYLKKHLKIDSTHSAKVIAYLAMLDELKITAPIIADSIIQELRDQRNCLKMIASENYSSLTVQLAMGNLMTDKYAEGYPLHRFYAGCDNVDHIELQAATLAKQLFQAEHAYVQPHSGADANLVAFLAILSQRVEAAELQRKGYKKLDELTPQEFQQLRHKLVHQKLLGLSLSNGGHLTHGYIHNISGKLFESTSYGVDPTTQRLDYDQIYATVQKEKPLVLIAGYSSYPRLINFAIMRQIADSCDAVLLVDMAHFAGLVAGGVFQGEYNPIPYAHIVTSTTHKTLRGPRGGLILCQEEFASAIHRGCPLVLGGPLPHIMAAKAIAFQEALSSDFKTYAHQIVLNAQALAKAFMQAGVKVLTDGTDNHLVILDISSTGFNGRQIEQLLKEHHITANRNMIPQDHHGPWYTSGIRLGTAALTTLGMKQPQMEEVATMITLLLKHASVVEHSLDPRKAKLQVPAMIAQQVRTHMTDILKQFPLYPELPML